MNIYRDFYDPVTFPFRKKRMAKWESVFKPCDRTSILDVGGFWRSWSFIEAKPQITILNLEGHQEDSSSARYIAGDGCALQFPDQSFDIVYSNSVIEHVGDWKRQKQFASEVRRVGRSYYVQTPNRWFFLEPHLLTPFVHWLPASLRSKLLCFSWRFLIAKPSPEDVADLRGIRLLDEKEMCELFPDAEIWKEKFLGMTKSLIAVNRALPSN